MPRLNSPEECAQSPSPFACKARVRASAYRACFSGLAAILCTLGFSCGGAETPGAASPSESGPKRVIVLVIDALNADHLGSYDPRPNKRVDLTPHIDAIAAEGRRFTNAISNNTWTLPSTTSLMTGLLQENHKVTRREGVVPLSADLLPERFQDAGWKTRSFVQMTYASKLYGFDQGFDETSEYGFGGGPGRANMAGEVVQWMEDNADERYFLYLHFRRPHGVYNAPASVRARVTPSCVLAGTQRGAELEASQDFAWMELTDDEKKHVRHLYRANLATVDQTLGPILELARAPETLLVVTSDHGEGLGEHDFYGHGPSVYRENIHIPLIYRGPGVQVGVDQGLASTVDLRPTLMEMCELWEPASIKSDGGSLARRLAGEELPPDAEPVRFSSRYGTGRAPSVGLMTVDATMFVGPLGELHLFGNATDLEQRLDWGAMTDDEGCDPSWLAMLPGLRERQQAYAYLSEAPSGEAPQLTAEDRADLKALGYAGD